MGLFDHSEEEEKIQLDEVSRAHMLEIGRWGKFLSIVGFVMIGIMVVAGLAMSVFLSKVSGYNTASPFGTGFLTFFYIFIGAIHFYPTFALFKYSTMVKKAIESEDQYSFNVSLGHLKGAFKYIGILTIVIIAIYIFIIFFAIAT